MPARTTPRWDKKRQALASVVPQLETCFQYGGTDPSIRGSTKSPFLEEVGGTLSCENPAFPATNQRFSERWVRAWAEACKSIREAQLTTLVRQFRGGVSYGHLHDLFCRLLSGEKSDSIALEVAALRAGLGEQRWGLALYFFYLLKHIESPPVAIVLTETERLVLKILQGLPQGRGLTEDELRRKLAAGRHEVAGDNSLRKIALKSLRQQGLVGNRRGEGYFATAAGREFSLSE